MLLLAPYEQPVEAGLLGEDRVFMEGSMLIDDYRKKDTSSQDALFKQASLDAADEAKYIDFIRRPQVDVVLARKELSLLMNRLGTMSTAMFLAEYEHYYKNLRVDDTSRPMLKAYLGLMAAPGQIKPWYDARAARFKDSMLANCRDLFAKRKQVTSSQPDWAELVTFLRQIKANYEDGELRKLRLRLAYLVQQNNNLLFRLDFHLLLCATVERSRLADELSGEFEFLF